MKEEKVCAHCGEVLEKGQVYEFGGEVMCKTCFDAKNSMLFTLRRKNVA